MWAERIFYFLREAGRNYRTNPVVTGVSTGIISLSILIFGIFLVIFLNFRSFFEHWGRKVRVDAYLVENIGSPDTQKLESAIRGIPGVEKIEFVSADDALKEFKQMLGGQETLLSELETNPLPASFKIHPANGYRTPESVRKIADAVGKLTGIAEVRYGAEWVEKFSALIRVLQLVGAIIGGILLLSSLLIISNTIRLTIYARREEIDIMRLVGATETFIRIPFFLEGLFQGLVAGSIALALLWGIYWIVLARVDLPLSTLGPVRFQFLSTGVSLELLLGGTMLGLLGSAFAMSRMEEKEEENF